MTSQSCGGGSQASRGQSDEEGSRCGLVCGSGCQIDGYGSWWDLNSVRIIGLALRRISGGGGWRDLRLGNSPKLVLGRIRKLIILERVVVP